MSLTKTVSIGEHSIVLKRPTFKEFQTIIVKVEALMRIRLHVAMTTPEFTEAINLLTVEAPLDSLDHTEVEQLWQEALSFCEFDGFFARQGRQHYERLKEEAEMEVDLQAVTYERMKKRGLLPESFSIEHLLTENVPAIPAFSPPSLPSTPTTSDGPESKSSKRTTGSSPETTQKPSGVKTRQNA